MNWSKYHAKKCEIDGIKFASKMEGARYVELKLLEQAGEIKDLKLQVSYPIIVNGYKICKYIADFVYKENGKIIVEDKKGVLTPAFRLKQKLMRAVHNIEIRIT